MKIKIFLMLFICLGLNKGLMAEEITDFKNELNNIANSFVENVLDEYKCNNVKRDAKDLADKIKDYLEDESENLTLDEKRELVSLRKQAESLGVYINMCCGSSVAYPTVEEFQLANALVHAEVTNLNKDKFCIDIIKIRINNFSCMAVMNIQTTGYKVKFSWKDQNSGISGKVDMGVAKKSIRPFCNNCFEKLKENLVFTNVICKAFEYNL